MTDRNKVKHIEVDRPPHHTTCKSSIRNSENLRDLLNIAHSRKPSMPQLHYVFVKISLFWVEFTKLRCLLQFLHQYNVSTLISNLFASPTFIVGFITMIFQISYSAPKTIN